jgi:sulfate transport system substrate-binding protein
VKPGVAVITPNPFAVGGARWNVLAGYGAKSNKGADKAAGVAFLDALFGNVPVQDTSARASLQTFTGGKGDAILAYENEAIFARQHGQELDYTIPDSTILIENPIAVTKNSAHPAQAKAFLDFARGSADSPRTGTGRPYCRRPTFPYRACSPSRTFWSSVNKELRPATGIVAGIEQKRREDFMRRSTDPIPGKTAS